MIGEVKYSLLYKVRVILCFKKLNQNPKSTEHNEFAGNPIAVVAASKPVT